VNLARGYLYYEVEDVSARSRDAFFAGDYRAVSMSMIVGCKPKRFKMSCRRRHEVEHYPRALRNFATDGAIEFEFK
jgi:hypothetical protein